MVGAGTPPQQRRSPLYSIDMSQRHRWAGPWDILAASITTMAHIGVCTPPQQRDRPFTVDIVSATDGWAVGAYGRIYHYNGSNWSLHTTTTEGTTVRCHAQRHKCWAVENGAISITTMARPGVCTPPRMKEATLIQSPCSMPRMAGSWEIWAVSTTTMARAGACTPTTAEGSSLQSVAMLSATDGWAVGYFGRIYHYDGSNWSLHTTTAEGSYLWSVAVL